MKNKMKLLTGALLVSLLLMSCEKDDKTVTKNYLKIDSTEYNLSAGNLINFGTRNGYEGYNIDLHLYSEGVTFDDGTHYGKGHVISFYMSSPIEDDLGKMDYVLNSAKLTPKGAYKSGFYVIDADFEAGENSFEGSIKEGVVSVSKKGTEYTITINCKNEDGKSVKGFYKGKLDYSID